MSEYNVITPMVRNALGKELGPPVDYEVEKSAIRKVAEAMGDPNPLWQDEKYAGETKYSSVIAPPTFLASMRNPAHAEFIQKLDIPLKRQLAGGVDIELLHPIKPRDIISVSTKLAEANERTGSLGRMLILVFETTFTNQESQLVARLRQGLIRY